MYYVTIFFLGRNRLNSNCYFIFLESELRNFKQVKHWLVYVDLFFPMHYHILSLTAMTKLILQETILGFRRYFFNIQWYESF